jgi:hypothetical protein
MVADGVLEYGDDRPGMRYGGIEMGDGAWPMAGGVPGYADCRRGWFAHGRLHLSAGRDRFNMAEDDLCLEGGWDRAHTS